jgi:hypothetical protein
MSYQEKKLHHLSLIGDISCIDCGIDDFILLDFDHREGADKLECISNMIGRVRDSCLMNEISKCDVRCANCHRIKTAFELGRWVGRPRRMAWK